MSKLRLFRPTAHAIDSLRESRDSRGTVAGTDEPVILSFPDTYARLRRGAVLNPLIRARLLYHNRCCPACRHPHVEPLELNDAVVNRKNMPIPGTATLVGFHCHKCDREWPA